MTVRAGLDARQAARALRITRATLYAYVSRGLIGAEPDPADPRRRLYRAADIERLKAGKARGRKPKAIALGALDWGIGGLPSRITLVEGSRLYYRGQDAIELARTASLEAVARLLWECGSDDPFGTAPPPAQRGVSGVAPLDRCRAALLSLGARPLWNRENARLACDGAALLRAITACALDRPPSACPAHEQITDVWRLDADAADVVRAALVLLADHELNASTFAARVVASTGASLSACLSAGFAALSGPLHGGATALAEALFASAEQVGGAVATVEARLARGEAIPAFGHPLYPDGDPRAAFILARLPADPIRAALIATVAEIGGHAPNVDFALASLTRSFGLPAGSGLVLFALARSVGWIAHAIEQSGERKLIRPRADYVGIRPAPITRARHSGSHETNAAISRRSA